MSWNLPTLGSGMGWFSGRGLAYLLGSILRHLREVPRFDCRLEKRTSQFAWTIFTKWPPLTCYSNAIPNSHLNRCFLFSLFFWVKLPYHVDWWCLKSRLARCHSRVLQLSLAGSGCVSFAPCSEDRPGWCDDNCGRCTVGIWLLGRWRFWWCLEILLNVVKPTINKPTSGSGMAYRVHHVMQWLPHLRFFPGRCRMKIS